MKFNLENLTPDIRHAKDMGAVIYDQEWLKNNGNDELYFMYRGLEEKNNLRYDITVVPAKMMGKEPVKTKGHYHAEGRGEVYMVLEGTAIYLMQKRNPENDSEIKDTFYIKAEKGDVAIIPSGYGHVTINPSATENLKMANWVSKDCKSDYSLFEKLKGACYYYVSDPESKKTKWIKNESYLSVPEIKKEKPIKSLPEDLDFLNNTYSGA